MGALQNPYLSVEKVALFKATFGLTYHPLQNMSTGGNRKTDAKEGAAGRNIAEVPLLQATHDPTTVVDHLKKCVIAFQMDGKTNETQLLDPRVDYEPWMSRIYDAEEDGMSDALLATLGQAQADAATLQNIVRFEGDRKKANQACRESEKGLFHDLKKSLSSNSLGRVKALDMARYDLAEVHRDTEYLVKAIIISHSTDTSTGISAITAHEILQTRVQAYLSFRQGALSLEQYLSRTYELISAIKSMDGRVDDNNEGGYVGDRKAQVAQFLVGTGATKVINAFKNGTIVDAPSTLEDVCTLITNWSGELCEPGSKNATSSIMTTYATEDESIYGIGVSSDATKSKDAQKKPGKTSPSTTTKEPATTAAPLRFGLNPGAPMVPLVRTDHKVVPTDRKPCGNCGGYHADPRQRDTTKWFSCPVLWNEHFNDLNKAYVERRRQAESRAPRPPAATIGHVSTLESSHGYTAEESALAHAAVMASRSQSRMPPGPPPGQQIYHSYQRYGGPPTWTLAPRQTDAQGWTIPWDPESHQSNYMMSVVEDTEDEPEPQPYVIKAIEAMRLRRIASLAKAKTPTRIEKAKDRVRTCPQRPHHPGVPPWLTELEELTASMPPTTRGRHWVWPPIPDITDAAVFDREQESARRARLHPAHEQVYTSQANPGISLGVKGVSYPTLPARSNHRDPGHPIDDIDEDLLIPAWMFDSGAGVAGFKDLYGLSPAFQLDRPITVGGIISANNLVVTTGAMLDNVRVLHDRRFGANCLPSSAIVDAGWKVNYHEGSDSYQVITASGQRLGFHRFIMANGAITKHYLCHPSMPYQAPKNMSTDHTSETVAATNCARQSIDADTPGCQGRRDGTPLPHQHGRECQPRNLPIATPAGHHDHCRSRSQGRGYLRTRAQSLPGLSHLGPGCSHHQRATCRAPKTSTADASSGPVSHDGLMVCHRNFPSMPLHDNRPSELACLTRHLRSTPLDGARSIEEKLRRHANPS